MTITKAERLAIGVQKHLEAAKRCADAGNVQGANGHRAFADDLVSQLKELADTSDRSTA